MQDLTQEQRQLVEAWAAEARARIDLLCWELDLKGRPLRLGQPLRRPGQRTPSRGERALVQADAWGAAQ